MISSVSSLGMNGGGMDALESRIQQIESLIQTIEGRKAAGLEGPSNAQPANPLSPAEETNAPKPFQFYLKNASASVQDAASKANPTAKLPSLNHPSQTLQPVVENLSGRYGVDKNLVNAIIQQESGFNPSAVSRAGAQGLMQLMPATAQQLGVTNPQDPVQNLDGGIRYMKGLLDQYNGNIPLALAAYNAGSGAVAKYKGIPPYTETQNYVRNILSMYLQNKQKDPIPS